LRAGFGAAIQKSQVLALPSPYAAPQARLEMTIRVKADGRWYDTGPR